MFVSFSRLEKIPQLEKKIAASKLGETGNDHEEQDNQRVKKNNNMVFMVVTKKSKEIKKLCR